MKQTLLSFLVGGMILTSVAFAQEKKISGRVTSAEGKAIPGVTVVVQGTNQATQTDTDGNYSLNVPAGKVVVFRSVGFDDKTIIVNNNSTVFNVSLVNHDNALEEVVVVGYGSTTKESFTGSAKKINADNIDKKNVSNVSQALAGEVAGLQVTNSSGQPGTTATVRVRGYGSVNGSRDPLYVVDGVPFSGNLTSINNADIANITVLKDAAATAIYGSRGANGVIIVTTKNGKGKKSFVEADVNYGVNMSLLPRYDVIKSPEQYVALGWEGIYNYGKLSGYTDDQAITVANNNLFKSKGIGLDPSNNIWNTTNVSEMIDPETRTFKSGVARKWNPENWEDEAFQSSSRLDANVKFGGGTDKSDYFTSFGYLKDKGYSVNSDFERFSGRLNLNQKVTSWLNAGVNLNFARTTRNNNGQTSDSGSIFWFVDNMPSIYPLFQRDANGNRIADDIYGGYVYDYGNTNSRRFGSLTNAIADATYDINRHERNEISGRGYLNFNIAKGLTFENTLGMEYYNNVLTERGNKYYGSSASQGGSLYRQTTELKNLNLLNLLRYKTSFEGGHNLEALVAHEITDYSQHIGTVSGYNLVDNDILEFNNVAVSNPVKSYVNDYTLESFFGQVNYDYSRKYYLSGTIRRDGSSRFLKDKWGTFGSLGAGWIVSNEDFLSGNSTLPYLKLKASYGILGDQAGVGYYPGYDLYDVQNVTDEAATIFDTKGNPDLTWETSKMFQVGVEFDLGKYVTGSVEYYVKNTSDLIFNKRYGTSTGYAFIKVNDGNLRNQGLEFDLTGHLWKGTKGFVDLSVNGETFTNKITKMPLDPTTNLPKELDVQAPYAWAKDHSIFDYYMVDFAGVDPADGASTWKVFYTDNNNNGQFDSGEQIASLSQFSNPDNTEVKESTTKTYAEATQYFIGKSSLPKLRGAFTLRAGYANFDFAAQFVYRLGGYAYDYAYAGLMGNGYLGSNNWSTDILKRWQKEGDITDVPRISNNHKLDPNVNSRSTRFLTKANYLSLNNVRLGYTFKQAFVEKAGLSNLNLWVSGDNLWLGSARKGFNPSASENGNTDTYSYSPLSTVSVGLRAKF
ncbi:SusC/RagA family TonB-linked outer membrane protein [Sphingobacterium multivorum]|uniref:SusC/RagA family TonB-linked outer membrane protein n=1 Tax=Sphingobacterium multivorum TaxID=28454 RepID=UPI003DA43C3E